MMKTTLILVFSAFVSCGYAQMDTPQQMTGFATNLYKIQYPISWRLDTSRIMGTELLLFSPLESETDKFSENVNVAIQDLGGQNIDLEKYIPSKNNFCLFYKK